MTTLLSAALAAVPLLLPLATATAQPTGPARPAAIAHCTDYTQEKQAGHLLLIPSIGANTRRFHCQLGRGDSNPGVFVMQVALTECNGLTITPRRQLRPADRGRGHPVPAGQPPAAGHRRRVRPADRPRHALAGVPRQRRPLQLHRPLPRHQRAGVRRPQLTGVRPECGPAPRIPAGRGYRGAHSV